MFGLLARRVVQARTPPLSIAISRQLLARSFFSARVLADPAAKTTTTRTKSASSKSSTAGTKKTVTKKPAATKAASKKKAAVKKPAKKPAPKKKAVKKAAKPTLPRYRQDMAAPKTRVNPYSLFLSQNYPKGVDFTTAAREVYAKWKALPEAEVQAWREKAAALAIVRKEEYAQWLKDTPLETIKIVNAREIKRNKPTHSKLSLGPKRPASGYIRFSVLARPKYVDQAPQDLDRRGRFSWIAQRVKEEWDALPESEKTSLRDAAKTELAEWKRQVDEMGLTVSSTREQKQQQQQP